MIFTQEAPLTQKWFSGRSRIQMNWNLEMLVFEERGKLEKPKKNLLEQKKEPKTNITHTWPHWWEVKSLLPEQRQHHTSKDFSQYL